MMRFGDGRKPIVLAVLELKRAATNHWKNSVSKERRVYFDS